MYTLKINHQSIDLAETILDNFIPYKIEYTSPFSVMTFEDEVDKKYAYDVLIHNDFEYDRKHDALIHELWIEDFYPDEV